MRPAAQIVQWVYVRTTVRVVDLDETAVNPTIVSEQYPHIEYRDLMEVSSQAAFDSTDPRVAGLLGEAGDKLYYEVKAGRDLRPDELDIVRAVRKADHRKDETGNDIKLTLGEFLEAMKDMGITFVESLDREVVRSG